MRKYTVLLEVSQHNVFGLVISSVKTPNTSSAAALTVLININTEALNLRKHQITVC
jgi:hypothetical protein